MKEFDLIDLTNLFFSGYRYVIVKDRRDHAILEPLMQEAEEALIKKMGFYQLPILDNEILDLARGVGWLPAFLPQDFFEENNKLYVLS